MNYKKSQIGWAMIAIFSPFLVLLLFAYLNQWGTKPLPFVPFLVIESVLISICALFYQLTVELHQTTLQLTYGIGLIRIKFKIDELEKVEKINTPWYYGLGIRVTPQGMLYNINGTQALRITYFKMGKKKSVMVGTPEPDLLKKAMEAHWSKR